MLAHRASLDLREFCTLSVFTLQNKTPRDHCFCDFEHICKNTELN